MNIILLTKSERDLHSKGRCHVFDECNGTCSNHTEDAMIDDNNKEEASMIPMSALAFFVGEVSRSRKNVAFSFSSAVIVYFCALIF